MIFYPFNINEMEDQIIEYHGELEPDSNYFNQFSHRGRVAIIMLKILSTNISKETVMEEKIFLSFTPISGVFQPT